MQSGNILNTLGHSTVQVLVGITAGTIVDTVFPTISAKPTMSDTEVAIELGAEIIAQTAAASLLTAAFVRLMMRLPIDKQDPTNGFAFLLGIVESQPNLIEKVRRLSAMLSAQVTGDMKWVRAKFPTRVFADQNQKHGTLPSANPN